MSATAKSDLIDRITTGGKLDLDKVNQVPESSSGIEIESWTVLNTEELGLGFTIGVRATDKSAYISDLLTFVVGDPLGVTFIFATLDSNPHTSEGAYLVLGGNTKLFDPSVHGHKVYSFIGGFINPRHGPAMPFMIKSKFVVNG